MTMSILTFKNYVCLKKYFKSRQAGKDDLWFIERDGLRYLIVKDEPVNTFTELKQNVIKQLRLWNMDVTEIPNGIVVGVYK